jgi:hypothetical protein
MNPIPTPHDLPRRRAPAACLLTLGAIGLLAGCGGEEGPEPPAVAGTTAETAADSPQDAWWANLSAPCGEAFPGGLAIEPPGDEMLRGDELLVVHFHVCEEDEIRLPFHIESEPGVWDRSRTWIFRRADDGRLELRHDHRLPDGAEDEVTWYGAWTVEEGSATEQRFVIRDRDYPDGRERGWRVIIEPGVRYVYGTTRGGEWSWRVDFDLSRPMEELPPPAWGYEDGSGPPR